MQNVSYATGIQRPLFRPIIFVGRAWHVNVSDIFVGLAVVINDGSVMLRTNIVLEICSLTKLEFLLQKKKQRKHFWIRVENIQSFQLHMRSDYYNYTYHVRITQTTTQTHSFTCQNLLFVRMFASQTFFSVTKQG